VADGVLETASDEPVATSLWLYLLRRVRVSRVWRSRPASTSGEDDVVSTSSRGQRASPLAVVPHVVVERSSSAVVIH
jgi:hypothetical protein